jgi:hypothetical protein
MEVGLGTLFLAVFLAETVKNFAKGSANWIGSNGKFLFYDEFTALGLSESATPEAIARQLEAKPEIIEVIEQKVETNPEFIKELFEIIKAQVKNNQGNINKIKAEKIENVFNQPSGTFNFTHKE